jgi:hypothetical protein
LLRTVRAVLFRSGKNAGMKLQHFPEVCQEILRAVVARIEMIFMWDAFRLKLPVEFRGSFVKSEFVISAAVEIDGQG